MKTPRRLLWFSVLLALAIPYSALAAPALQSEVARTPDEWCSASVPAADPVTRDFNSAEQVLQPGVDYRAIFCTEVGSVYVDLFESQTPVTVNNFVFLSQQGYYNNTTFHRVIQNFMAQGGDPTATGTGGPNYRFQDEFVASLRFDGPGKLAMANAGPGTNGSQFFITAAATPHLNDLHTIFGQVLSGQANVIGIRLRDPGVDTEPGTRLDTVIIITDPAAVRIESVDLPVRADVVTAMDRVDQIITPDVADLLENRKSNQAAEDVLAAQPEAARADAETALTAHNFQYRVSSIVNNKACDLNAVQFIDVGYRLDAFATVDDASAAAVDPAYAALLEKEGYIAEPSDALPHPVFRQTLTICDQPAVRAVTFWQRGPFVAVIQITLPANSDGIESLGRILSEFVAQRIYEPLLLDVLYRDIQ